VKKEKRRVFSANWTGGDFGPAELGRARGGRRPSRPTEGRNGASERHGCGPTRQGEEGVTVSGGEKGGSRR
jgi:hypothetical protein